MKKKKDDRPLLSLKVFSWDTDSLNNAKWFYCEKTQNLEGESVLYWKSIT